MEIVDYQQVWTLWLQHRTVVRSYLEKRTQNETLADDLTQELLLKLHRSCCSGRPIRNARAYLLQAAHHLLVDHYRSCTPEPVAPAAAASVYHALGDYVDPLLGFLPSGYAVPVRLSDLQGWRQDRVAAHIGLSLTATKSRIQRGRKLLRREVETCFDVEPGRRGILDFRLKDHCTPLRRWCRENCR